MDNKYNFAVILPSKSADTTGFYKKGLVDRVLNNYPWLKVAGVDSPYYTKNGRYIRGVDHAGPGNVLTFGTAKNHDVNWVERPDYVREKGYTPVYDLVKDWNTVINRLDAFAKSRKPAPRYSDFYSTGCNKYCICGVPVEVFDNFYKIGYNIIPRYPRENEYYIIQKPEVVKVIVTIKSLF